MNKKFVRFFFFNEFNCLTIANCTYYNEMNVNENDEWWTYSNENLITLFRYFNKVYVTKKDFWNTDTLSYISKLETEKTPTLEMLQKCGYFEAYSEFERFVILNNGEIMTHTIDRLEEHPYDHNFRNTVKMILDSDNKMEFKPILPREKDYLDIVDTLPKEYYVIIGRNVDPIKHSSRNNLFIEVIEYLLSQNKYVINLTNPTPNLDIKNPLYKEICPDTYSKFAVYIQYAKLVFSKGDSGGISTNIQIPGNFWLLNGGWIDNPQFGFNGKSIVDALLEKGWGIHYEHGDIKNINIARSIDESIQFIPSIQNKFHMKFFDENKIYYHVD